MHSLLVLDGAASSSRILELLSAMGRVTIATTASLEQGVSSMSSSTKPLPSNASGWRAMVDDADAVVHLGGASQLTNLLAALSSPSSRQRVLVALPTDERPLALLARATLPNLRVCCARPGACVAETDGLVRALLPLYNCFLGLRAAPDEPPIFWCHEYDLARAIVFAIESKEMTGIFDLVTPEPALVGDLDSALSQALDQRPLLRTTLSTAARLLGERLSRELARSSARFPTELARHGFSFVFPDIRSAVFDVLQSHRPSAR